MITLPGSKLEEHQCLCTGIKPFTTLGNYSNETIQGQVTDMDLCPRTTLLEPAILAGQRYLTGKIRPDPTASDRFRPEQNRVT